MALNCGGVVLHNGWLRLLGGGHGELLDLAAANEMDVPTEASVSPAILTVGYDVLGGQFAIDGGGLEIAPGQVCYFGPDTLSWAGLGLGYGAFLAWNSTDQLGEAYRDLRWPAWESELNGIGLDKGLSFYPPLFSKEAANKAACTRRVVPMAELIGYHRDMEVQLSSLPDQARFEIRATE